MPQNLLLTDAVSVRAAPLPQSLAARAQSVTKTTANGSSQRANLRADGGTEYVAGGAYYAATALARVLPKYIDDVTQELRHDLYEQMLRDPHIAGDVNLIKAACCANGVRLSPAPSEGKRDNKKAYDICAFHTRAIAAMRPGIRAVLRDMLDGVALGHTVAEIVYKDAGGQDAGKWFPTLKPKPRDTTAFVVDASVNLIGIAARLAGQGWAYLQTGQIADLSAPNLLPVSKFAIFSFRTKNGDPRGTSILRPAYDAWWRKRQIEVEHLKYLATYATPSLIGKVGAGSTMGQPVLDAYGNHIYDADGLPVTRDGFQGMQIALSGFGNNRFLVINADDEVTALVPPDRGEVFTATVNDLNNQISHAILSNTLTTSEGKSHGTRGAADNAKSISDLVVEEVEGILADMLHGVLCESTRINFGEDAMELTPIVSLSAAEESDVEGLAGAFVPAGYSVAPSHLPAIDAKLGLPNRTPEEMATAAKAHENTALPPAPPVIQNGKMSPMGDKTGADEEGGILSIPPSSGLVV